MLEVNLKKSESNLRIKAYYTAETRIGSELTEFVVDFNPNTFNVTNRITYDIDPAINQTGGDPTFKGVPPLTFNIEFTIDGTGVSLGSVPSGQRSNYVKNRIKDLREVTGSRINGDIHRPNYLALLWGTFYIECVITSLNVTYNLFDRDGTPLRAKVICSFIERLGPGKDSRQSRFESPDLTKYKTIKEGDILPLISKRNYNNAAYYIQVARANKLKNFRNIPVGTKMVLPPIADKDE